MKIVHICYSDGGGGAARAAYRLHRSHCDLGLNSRMLVVKKTTDDDTVELLRGIRVGLLREIFNRLVQRFFLFTSYHIVAALSLSFYRSGLADMLNGLDCDIVNLHWVGLEMISIREIGELHMPLVWTLHDCWPLLGLDHYPESADAIRLSQNYDKMSRPRGGLNFDRWSYLRKINSWSDLDLNLIALTEWPKKLAGISAVTKNRSISVVGLPLDLKTFRPEVDVEFLDGTLNSPDTISIVYMGAGGGSPYIKGGDLLVEALKILASSINKRVLLLVVGSGRVEPILGVEIRHFGKIADDALLRKFFSNSSVTVVPSRMETYCQVATESMACGTPVVAFDATGPASLIEHLECGYLAKSYDVQDFARGIKWVSDNLSNLRCNARVRAEFLCDPRKVASSYRDIYKSILQRAEMTDCVI